MTDQIYATLLEGEPAASGDALPVCLCCENASRPHVYRGIWSLLDLTEYSAHHLYKLLSHLTRQITSMYREERERGAYATLRDTPPVISGVLHGEVAHAERLLSCARAEFDNLEMVDGIEQVDHLRCDIRTVGLAEYRSRITVLREMLEGELKRRHFAYIPKDRAEYFEKQSPFGRPVASAFPNANREAIDASNCIAGDLPTAAVFHLMRCAELGMRAVARERRVKIKNVESIELAEWSQILKRLDKETEAVQNWKGRTKIKAKALEFYSGTAGELRGFRDEYRNHVSHTRKPYTLHAATDAFTKVRCFMERLSICLSENSKSAIKWTKV